MRYPEIDTARATAIAGMVVYHTAFDLSQFYGFPIDVFSGPWKLLQVCTASLFLVVVGVSFAVSSQKSTHAARWKRVGKRFLRIASAACIVSIATYLVDADTYVRFGILHLIAVSSLLLPLIAPLRIRTLFPGLILLFLGPIIYSLHTESWLLLPLGIRPVHFQTVDYYPLIPWFGVVLIGYAMGYLLYGGKKRAQHAMPQQAPARVIQWVGRHSLLVYLVHQPVILFFLWAILGPPRI